MQRRPLRAGPATSRARTMELFGLRPGSRYGLRPDAISEQTTRVQDAFHDCGRSGALLALEPGRYVTATLQAGAAGERHALTVIGYGWNSDVQEDAALDSRGVVLVLADGATGPHISCLPDQGPMHFEGLLGFGNQANQNNDNACFIDFPNGATAQRSGTLRRLYYTRYRGGGIKVGHNRNAGLIEAVTGLNCGYLPNAEPLEIGKNGVTFGSCSDWRMLLNDFGAMSGDGIANVGAGTLEITMTNSFSNRGQAYNVYKTARDSRWVGGSMDRGRKSAARIVGHADPSGGDKHILENVKFAGNSQDLDDEYSDIELVNCEGDVIIKAPQFSRSGATPILVKHNIEVAGTTDNIIVSDWIQIGPPTWRTSFCNDPTRLITYP